MTPRCSRRTWVGMMMLEIAGLDVRYGHLHAVRQSSLSVGDGEFVGLIGANGAGKSSLLAAVVGWVKPAGGKIMLDGAMLNGLSPEKIAARGVGIVPEGRQVFSRLTVSENLRVALSGLRRSQRVHDPVGAAAERFPALTQFWNRPAGSLSGGQQQQLVIARALVAKPRLLVLDEPSLGLAPLVVSGVFATLRSLSADGMTILLVEQNAAKTLKNTEKTYAMTNGRIRIIDRENGISTTDLIASYLGDERTKDT